MIPSIDPGIGLKEERSAPRPKQAGSPDSGFARVLNKATGQDGPARDKSVNEARPARDDRARTQYGKKSGEGEKPASAEAKSAVDESTLDEKTLDQAAETADQPIQELLVPEMGIPGLMLAQGQVGEDVAPTLSETMNMTEPESRLGSAEQSTPIVAQLGQAAYRLGSHGNAEGQFSPAAGVTPQSEAGAELAQAAGELNPDQAFEPAKLKELSPELKRMAALLGEPRRLALEKSMGMEQGLPKGVEKNDALTRNDILGRLAAGTSKEEAMATQQGLQLKLQMEGLLQKNVRTMAGELKPAKPGSEALSTLFPVSTGEGLAALKQAPKQEVLAPRTLDEIVQQVRFLATNKQQEVTLKLHPEHLGQRQLKMVQKDGHLQVDMTVDNPVAKSMLETHMHELRNRLEQGNPNQQYLFNVDVRQGGDPRQGLYSGRHTPDPSAIMPDEADAMNDVVMARAHNPNGGLSIYA